MEAGVTFEEFGREALIARKPKVALIDELAHTNAPGSISKKRFQDVLAVLRAGIDVITTLNIQHLEALGDAVFRLTGTTVRETLPDGILELADEVILIDVSPETLRERLRQGKIYSPERIESALANFFKIENLRALRELAVREALRAERRAPILAPFDRLLLSVAAKNEDLPLILRCSKIAARLHVDFVVAHVSSERSVRDVKRTTIVQQLENETQQRGGKWITEISSDVPCALLQISRTVPETTIAVGGTHRTPKWFQPSSFARRILNAGAKELIVLARRSEALP
jgi:two-component system sensor histidine kinase KdpD